MADENINKNKEKDITAQLALIRQMVENAEDSIKAAKDVLNDLAGHKTTIPVISKTPIQQVATMGTAVRGKIIKGLFDGQNMVGEDTQVYPVPANYASKSKLVEGDQLKLTIGEDGSFIYKQIAPIEREKVLGILVQDEKGDYRVQVDGKSYKVILASITYYKGMPGDRVTLVLPKGKPANWGAIENIIKQEDGGDSTPSLSTQEPEQAPQRNEAVHIEDSDTSAPKKKVASDEGSEEELKIE